MKRMNKMLLVAALAATTLSAQAEQKKGPAWLSDALFLTSSLKKHAFYNLLINNILYLCVT